MVNTESHFIEGVAKTSLTVYRVSHEFEIALVNITSESVAFNLCDFWMKYEKQQTIELTLFVLIFFFRKLYVVKIRRKGINVVPFKRTKHL